MAFLTNTSRAQTRPTGFYFFFFCVYLFSSSDEISLFSQLLGSKWLIEVFEKLQMQQKSSAVMTDTNAPL